MARDIGNEVPPEQWANEQWVIDTAQAYIDKNGLNGLIALLKRMLDTTDKRPSFVHRALANLPLSIVFTTNYDDLLERAFRDARKQTSLVVNETDISFMHTEGTGSQHCQTVWRSRSARNHSVRRATVRKSRDHSSYAAIHAACRTRTNSHAIHWLESQLSLLQSGLQEAARAFRWFLPPGYAVVCGPSNTRLKALLGKGIQVIQCSSDYDPDTQLATWLEDLLTLALAQTTRSGAFLP